MLATIIIDYTYYPFLQKPEEIISIRLPGLKLSKIINTPGSPARSRALEILESIISKGRIKPSRQDSETEVLAFHALLTAIKIIGDKKLAQKIAVIYSKHSWTRLREEPLPVIVSIAKALGINTEIAKKPVKIPVGAKGKTIIYNVKPVVIKLKDYLSLLHRLAMDPKYALVNQILDKGYVYLEKELFTRILEEAVARRIMRIYDEIIIENPDEYSGFINDVKNILEKTGWFEKQKLTVEIEKTTSGVIDLEAFPPCMKNLLNRLVNGENLGHHERFAIAAFLARIGMDVDTILEYFKHAPDYNEKIARYQIEHIAGLRGSRKKYLPYNCDTMKSYGLCPIQDYCEGGRNPLAVYKRNVWKKLRGKGGKKTNNNPKKAEE